MTSPSLPRLAASTPARRLATCARSVLVWALLFVLATPPIPALAQSAAQLTTGSGATDLLPAGSNGTISSPLLINAPGTYFLSRNVVVSGATTDAVDITASDVVLDLNGHTVSTSASGTTYNAAVHNYGVCANGCHNVTVRNGTINGFFYGVFLAVSLNGQPPFNDSVSYGHLAEDLHLHFNTVAGVYVQGGDSVVRHCEIVDTGDSSGQGQTNSYGVYGVGPNNHVLDCDIRSVAASASGAAGIGIDFGAGATNSLAEGNRIGGADEGIAFDASATGKYAHNLLAADVGVPFVQGTSAGGNVTPTITSPTSSVGKVGSAYSYQISASDDPTSFSARGLPGGLSIATASGVISGTPTTATASPLSVMISATNAVGTGTAVLKLTINPPAPVVTSESAPAGQVGVAYSYQIKATNAPTSYAVTGNNLPAGLSLNTASGLISGTPTAVTTSSVTVNVTATNAGGTGTGTITLTINPATPGITSPASTTGQVGVAFSYQITASNSPTSFSATGLPGGLSVNTSSGLISGTPTTAGTYSVTLGATNAGGTSNATINLTINPANPAITSSLTATGQVGVAFSYTITASNSPTSFAAAGLPNGLNVNTSTGAITGTPTVTGNFPVTISATNAGAPAAPL